MLPFQIEETDEARMKFSNAKAISSAQFFGDQNKFGDIEAQASLQKFSVCISAHIGTWQYLSLIGCSYGVVILSLNFLFTSILGMVFGFPGS